MRLVRNPWVTVMIFGFCFGGEESMKKYTTHSEKESRYLGELFVRRLRGGDCVCLDGELGAGKTTFVKGIAHGLGVKNIIVSPTFTLMNIYPLPKTIQGIHTLIHIDCYRVRTLEELIDIGIEDYLAKPDTLSIIEWPAILFPLLHSKTVKTLLLETERETKRSITLPFSV